MTLEVGLIAAALAIMLLAAFSTAIASRILHLPIDRWLGTIPPATRANFLFAWAIAPLVGGSVMLVLIFSPSLAYLLGFATDHCQEHGHHAHLCLIHTPSYTGGGLEWLILLSTGIVVLGHVLKTVRSVRRSHRALGTLLALAQPATAPVPHRIVDSPRPFAVTAGLVRPQVLVSGRLLEDLKPNELATVLSHEQSHQCRRDGMRLFTAEVLSVLHLPKTRQLILNNFNLALEQACDEAAAAQSGDRLQVAETIIKMARLVGSFNPVPGGPCASVTGSNVVSRVEGLLYPVQPSWSAPGAVSCLLVGSIVATGLACGQWWHHSTESLFSLFLR